MTEPKYKFANESEEVTPIKRTIAKTMEVTENFTVYDAIAYVAKMNKAVADKEAEIEGLKSMIKAYEDELQLIENELGVQAMEADYQKKLAEQRGDEIKDALKEELLKTGNFVEKDNVQNV